MTNNGELHRLLPRLWTELESEPTTNERRLRTAPLPVPTKRGPLATAVDHAGRRHLLVPVDSRRPLARKFSGSVLQLTRRPLEDEDSYQVYADLACLRADFLDLFTEMCAQVGEVARKYPENPVKALYLVTDRWKALFEKHFPKLGPEQMAGLFGELLVLDRLLDHDPAAHRLWRGPEGHRHDFSSGCIAVEVKASTDEKERRPRIHGLDQLEAPSGSELWLTWFRLLRTNSETFGLSFLELVRRMREKAEDETALLILLSQAGYSPADDDQYGDIRFAVQEERWYRVDEPGFPALTSQDLTSAGVPVSVQDVEYTINLSGDSPAPLPTDQVPQVIDRMTQEGS